MTTDTKPSLLARFIGSGPVGALALIFAAGVAACMVSAIFEAITGLF